MWGEGLDYIIITLVTVTMRDCIMLGGSARLNTILCITLYAYADSIRLFRHIIYQACNTKALRGREGAMNQQETCSKVMDSILRMALHISYAAT